MRTVTVIIPALDEADPLPGLVSRIREILDERKTEFVYEILELAFEILDVDRGTSFNSSRFNRWGLR